MRTRLAKVEESRLFAQCAPCAGSGAPFAWRPGVRKIFVLSLPRRLGVSRPESNCRATGNRRSLHDDEPGAIQRLDELLGDDASHDLASVIHPLAPAVAQRVGDGVGLRGCEIVGVCHGGRLAAEMERSKNGMAARCFSLFFVIEMPFPMLDCDSTNGSRANLLRRSERKAE
jgi:hypothetical protein